MKTWNKQQVKPWPVQTWDKKCDKQRKICWITLAPRFLLRRDEAGLGRLAIWVRPRVLPPRDCLVLPVKAKTLNASDHLGQTNISCWSVPNALWCSTNDKVTPLLVSPG